MAAPSPTLYVNHEAPAATFSPSMWQRFFWFIGGFNAQTLAKDECQAVRPKYSSMGALVLLTAILATGSGGYAIYTVFRDPKIALPAAVLWGFVVLALDRFLVSSTRKLAVLKDFAEAPKARPPYWVKTPWESLFIRIPIAIMIGFVVSKPIESRLMRPWINEYIGFEKAERVKQIEVDPAVKKIDDDLSKLDKDIEAQKREVSERLREAALEANGTGGSGQRGLGPIWMEADKHHREAVTKLVGLESAWDQRQKDRANQRTVLLKAADDEFQNKEKDRSIISDYAAIRKMILDRRPERKDEAHIAWELSWFLTVFFVFIECIPVLSKTISSFDPYDAALQEKEGIYIMDALIEARRKYAEASLSPKVDPPPTSSS